MLRAKRFVNKLATYVGFEMPEIQISHEREQELIDKIVRTAQQWRIEDLVILYAAQLMPASTIISWTVLMPWAPLLEFIGLEGWEYVAFMQNKENIRTIMERLIKERDKKV